MRSTIRSGLALGVAAVLAVATAATAYADTVAVDGDTASATNNFVVTACTSGHTSAAATSSGLVTLTSTGNGASPAGNKDVHFQRGTTVTMTQTKPAGSPVVLGGTPQSTVLPSSAGSNWNNAGQTVTWNISATVPANTTPRTDTITVTLTGTNENGNALTRTATYDVQVNCSDTTPPVLTLPPNQVKEATGATTPVTWTATANDAVDGARPATCTPASGSSFPVGVATVNCSATDLSGNTANGSFTVTVTDTTPPTVTAPANKSAEATSSAGAAVTYSGQSATDLVDGASTPTCAPASGSTFPLGATTVTCSKTDAHGNTGSATFTVTVGDTTAPVVTVPGNITREATGPTGRAVTYVASATDSVDGAITPTCAPASGSTFAITTTPVSCSATDAHSNTGTAGFNVTVQDTTPPVISGTPATATLEATSASGAALGAFGPTASDLVDGSVSVVCKTGSTVVGASYVYPLDATTNVLCKATDAHSNTGSSSYAITVIDSTGPDLNVPSNLTAEATGPGGAHVSFSATATDAVDGAVTPDCSADSGDLFPIGTTVVSCTATDTHGNDSNTLSFNVTVADTTPPAIAAHGGETAEATGPAGAAVTFTSPGWTDAVDGSGTTTCAPLSGSTFALGHTTVSCSVTDAHANAATPRTFDVHVVDTTAPVIDAHGDETAEATSAAGAAVAYTSPATSDVVDGAGTASCLPASGSTFALGGTTVTCSATDAAGNDATDTTFTVTVQDTTAPVVADVGDVVAEATSSAGAAVSFTEPGWTDAVDGSGTATCLPASGSTFSLGGHTVTCSYKDAAGNTGESSFMVTVQDTTAPIIAHHDDVTEEATSASGAVVSYTEPSTSDAFDGPGTASCTPAPGTQFALGGTTVTCYASDSNSNASIPTSFTVTVADTTAPVIAPHGDLLIEADGPTGSAVTYTSPGWTDAVDGSGTATCLPATGSTFALGDNTVTCTQTDAAGNEAEAVTFTIKVVDTTAPVIAPHGDETAEATSAAGAAVTYTSPGWTDAVDGSGSATCLPASGSTFTLGETTVTCTRTDAAGNAATPQDFTVTVQDTTAPAVDPMSDITAEATSASGAVVTFTAPGWTDAVDGSGTATCLPASGTTFSIGGHGVTCSRTDAHGNTGESSFNVVVQDTTAPIIAPHGDETVEATSSAGAVVTYTEPATSDAVDGPGTAGCVPPPGSQFSLGDTTVVCYAADANSNASIPTHFTVTVQDTTAPVIAPHGDVLAEATSAAGATVTYGAPAWTDAVDGSGSASCLPASGSTFAIGDTTVTCTTTDAAGNAADPVTFTLSVADTTAPVIAAHGDQTAEATSAAGASVTFVAPTWTDAVDGSGSASCLPASGSTFAIGDTTVTCTKTDAHGNTAIPRLFTVTVRDTTAPVIAPHGDVTAEATGPLGASVTYTAPTWTDAVDGTGSASCAPASGSTFALGGTTVTCTKTDAHGNAATAQTFTVTVRDTTAPVIAAHGNVTAEATGPLGAPVTYTAPTWTDAVDGTGSASCAPASGSAFGFGSTTVTCNVTDAHGNPAAPRTFTVTVADTTAPSIAAHADVYVNATGASAANVTYASPTWTDAVDGSGTTGCSPPSGSSFHVGPTTVTCTATDAHGNTATRTFKVEVGYAWSQFLQPIDAAPNNSNGKDSTVIAGTVFNKVKAGSAIPVKFTLGGDQGLSIFAVGSPSAAPVSCAGSGIYDTIEETSTATTSGLKYDATAGQYNYTWKTVTSWAGTCQRLTVKLADGSSHYAFFQFTK